MLNFVDGRLAIVVDKNQVLSTLLAIFNSTRLRLLPISELTELGRRAGLYADRSLEAAREAINNHLCFDRSPAYPFVEFQIGEHSFWGLETWLPNLGNHAPIEVVRAITPLPSAWQFEHVLKQREIETGALVLPRAKFNALVANLEPIAPNRRILIGEGYGYERWVCGLKEKEHTLESAALAEWFAENQVKPDDGLTLMVETDNECVLSFIAPWDRNAEHFLKHGTGTGRSASDAPIRDLIWDYLSHATQVVPIADIIAQIQARRSAVSAQRIQACLVSNPYLFASTGPNGHWGLTAWGIADIVLRDEPGKSLRLDDVMNRIARDDLIYQTLHAAKAFLSVHELTERIAQQLGVAPRLLTLAPFFNPDDVRLLRVNDTFALFEDSEYLIGNLVQVAIDLNQSLEAREHQVGQLQNALATQTEKTLVSSSSSEDAQALRIELKDAAGKLSETLAALVERERELDQVRHNEQIASARLTQAQIALDVLRAEHGAQVSELYRRNLLLDQRLTEAAAQLAQAQANVSASAQTHAAQVNEWEQRLLDVTTQLAQAKQTQNELDAEHRATIESLRQQLALNLQVGQVTEQVTAEHAAQVESLQQELATARAQALATAQRSDAARADHAAQVDDLGRQLVQARQTAESQICALEQQLAEANTQLEQEHHSAERAQFLDQQLAEVTAQAAQATTLLDQRAREFSNAQRDLQRISGQLAQAQQTLNLLQTEHATQIGEIKKQNRQLEQRATESATQLARMQDEARMAYGDLQTQVSRLKEQNAELTQKLADSAAELNRARQQAEKIQTEYTALLNEREKSLAHALKKLNSASDLLMKGEQDLHLARQQAQDFGAHLTRTTLELETLRTEHNKLLDELQQLREARRYLTETLQQLARSEEMLDKTHDLARKGFEQRTQLESHVNQYFDRPRIQVWLDILQGRKPVPPNGKPKPEH